MACGPLTLKNLRDSWGHGPVGEYGAEHLASCAVESTKADVGGTSACYTQRYQHALVSDGDPNGIVPRMLRC